MSEMLKEVQERMKVVREAMSSETSHEWKDTQRKQPVTWLWNGFGIVYWKRLEHITPEMGIYLGNRKGKATRRIELTTFHNGYGIHVFLPPIIDLQIATKGRIAWWYKRGLIDVTLFNVFRFKY